MTQLSPLLWWSLLFKKVIMMKILNIPRDTYFDSPCLQRDNVSFPLILQSHSHFVLLYFVLDPHSEIVSDSDTSGSVFRDHSWQGSGYQRGCQGLNPGQLSARKASCLLFHCSGPLIIFKQYDLKHH